MLKRLLVLSLGRLTLDVSVAASAPTVEVTMMVSRTVLVDSEATVLKLDQIPFPVETIWTRSSSNDEPR